MEEQEKMSATEMLERINRFYEKGKIVPERINEAAERIAERAATDPMAQHGTTFEELFGDV